MCRRVVPLSYLENPEMVDKSDLEPHTLTDEIQWFYQARRRGWWLYEKRIALDIEQRSVANIVTISNAVCARCY